MTKYLKTREGSIEDVVKQMQNKVMENDYQDKFKKALDKEGKPLGHMTGAEKKAFFNKVDKMHKGKNENAPSVADIDRLKKQGMKPVKEDLDSKDKPTVKKIITKLKGASQAHAGQAKDLEKAMKTEKVDNPYAVGMSQAMKSTGDNPPLKKSTITKAHDIAKSIKKDEMKETHMSTAKKQNQSQKDAKGEKEIIKNEDKEWKTFAQMRAEIDEACWDSHKQVGFKMKGGKRVPNCVPKNEEADKGKKEQEAGEDTRDKKTKTMTGQVATSPEMNPKVDYKY
jgi:hypothetical protein